MANKYNATVAKIKTIYGRRITPKNYSEMIGMSSVSDVADYLKKNTHYSDILSTVDTGTAHRGLVESMLRKDLFQTYMKITRFEGLARHEFYNYMFIRTEVTEILSCIRNINSKSGKHIDTIQIYYNPYSSIDFIELAKVKSFPDLLSLLKRTPYYNVLSGIVPNEKGKVDFSECEIRMRTYYFRRLLESLKVNKDDADALAFLINSDTDLINVINSYRLKAFFNEDVNVIEKNMLPFSGRLSSEKLKDIYSASTTEEFMVRFAKTYYGRQMADAGLDANDLEYSVQKLRYIYTKRALKRAETAPLSVYSFMTLRGIEVHNIITIIESIRYNLAPTQMEALLII